MAFDPDAYLAEKQASFNPDAYLAQKGAFNPDKYLGGKQVQKIPAGEQADQYTPEAERTTLDYIRGGLETGANVVTGAVAFPLGLIGGLGRAALTGENFDPAAGKVMKELTYAPRGDVGQEWSGKIGEGINSLGVPLMGIHGSLPPARLAPSIPKIPKQVEKIKVALDDLNSKEAAPKNISDLKATEGPNGQMALFDIPEEGRFANPYEAVPGDWRVDENGIPIKADLSMEANNLQEPLQRNLWGDELAPKHEQEAPKSLSEAIDSMDWAHKRGALKKTKLGRELEASGKLEASKLAADREANRVSEIAQNATAR
jgi:hypothetical protein